MKFEKDVREMITRINILQNEEGGFALEKSAIIPKNWVVEIKDGNRLFVVGLSKANPKRERILEYKIESECSLFLHNSSFDYYSYIRPKAIQDILDEHGIIKVVAVGYKLNIVLHVVNGIVENPIKYINGYDLIDREMSRFHVKDGDKEYFQVKLEFLRKKEVVDIPFVIQGNKDMEKNVLFIDRNKTIDEFNEKIKEVPALYDNNEFIFNDGCQFDYIG